MIEIVNIGGREYSFTKMNFFPAQKLGLRLAKHLAPAIGGLDGKDKKGLDLDMKSVVSAIQSIADEKILDDLILPIFQESNVSVVGAGKLNSQNSINQNFTIDQMFDFWELAYVVMEANFKGFFTQALERFGLQATGAQAELAPQQLES